MSCYVDLTVDVTKLPQSDKIKEISDLANAILTDGVHFSYKKNAIQTTAGTIPVNNFFAHWIKEIDIKRYGDEMPILPLTNTIDIYRYSDELLKQMPKDALKTIQNYLLYSKEKVVIYGDNNDRRAYYTTTNATARNRTNENLTDRTAKFQSQIKNEYIYRILLKYLCDAALVNVSDSIQRHAKVV